MLELGDFGEGDSVVDLGCGDGKVVRAIARSGVKDVRGYEISVLTYFFARFINFIVKSRSRIKFGNFWKKDFSDVDVVVCFLVARTMRDFEKLIWPQLKIGARVISNEFLMEGVTPYRSLGMVHLYVKE
jgi:ribosomal protein L11 methylase PrmA